MEKENCGNNSPLEDYDEDLINPPNDLTELASTSFIINQGIIDQSDSLKDEFYIHYKQLAIEKVVAATKVLDENNLKEMYSCAASTSNETSNLLNVKHDGLESAYHLLHTLKEKVKIQKTKGEECRKKYDAEMASCLSTYQEMQKLRREHDPLWPKREQARLDLFRLEVEYKMLMQKQKELKETENLRQEIRKKMRNAAIVELAEAMAERERCKKLTEEIEVAERKEAELAKQLESLELLAAEKNVEQEASTVMQSTFKPISIHSTDAKRLHELRMKDIDRIFSKTPPQQSRLLSSSHIERTSSPAKENKRVNVLDDTVIASRAQKKSRIQGNLNQEIISTPRESENEISELADAKRLHELRMKDIDRIFSKTPPQQSTATRLSSSSHIERTSSPAKENKRVNVLDDTVIASRAQKKSRIQGNLNQEIISIPRESENEISELVTPSDISSLEEDPPEDNFFETRQTGFGIFKQMSKNEQEEKFAFPMKNFFK